LEVIGSEVGACVAANCKKMYPESSLLYSTTGPCIRHSYFGSIGGGAKQLSLSTPHRRAKRTSLQLGGMLSLRVGQHMISQNDVKKKIEKEMGRSGRQAGVDQASKRNCGRRG
jgi:hypothetical protein